MNTAIKYERPKSWFIFDHDAISNDLVKAKATMLALTNIPFAKSWADDLQQIQLKREVAGTSRIEGAEFTDEELDVVFSRTPEQLATRSLRQAAAAVKAYQWIGRLPNDMPFDLDLVLNIHRLIVTGADDDHCPPGKIRERDQNVTFGIPKHRGVTGGEECKAMFKAYCDAFEQDSHKQDPLVCAFSAHYHLVAMHPFLDGNGRTARALEAYFLQRNGLGDSLFIAMSNYYYEEKDEYLKILSDVRAANFDLTSFLKFGLRGIEIQCRRLLEYTNTNISKALYRDVMYELFGRLKTTRKRVLAERQLKILSRLLESDCRLDELIRTTSPHYNGLLNPVKAVVRDLRALLALDAVRLEHDGNNNPRIMVNLSWPTKITETEFFEKVKKMPKAKTLNLPQI